MCLYHFAWLGPRSETSQNCEFYEILAVARSRLSDILIRALKRGLGGKNSFGGLDAGLRLSDGGFKLVSATR